MFKNSSAKSGHDRRDHIIDQVALGVLFLLFGYVVWMLLQTAFGWAPGWLLGLFSLISLTFTATSLITLWYPNRLFRWGHWLGSYWVGLLGILFGASILFDIIMDILPWFGWVVSPAVAGVISLGVAMVIFIYGTWESQQVLISRLTVDLPGLPDVWRGKKILFVADFHLGTVRRERFAEKVADAIAEVRPDVVLIGGDLFDGRQGVPESLIAPLKRLVAPFGVYFVTGNHEYFTNPEDYFPAIRGAGIKILNRDVVDIDGVQIAGVDYLDVGDRTDFQNVLADIAINPARPSILLKHVPDHLDIAQDRGISLVLSGHTHNGQIWPLSYFAYFVKEFYYGHHVSGGTQIYVTSGVGTNGAPFRLGTKSEIVAITLLPTNSESVAN